MPLSRLKIMSDWAGTGVHLKCGRAEGLSENPKLVSEIVQQELHIIQQMQSTTRGAD